MEAEDKQRLRQDSNVQRIREKQNEIGDRISRICNDLQMTRNAVIHVHNYDDTTEPKLDAILNRIEAIENLK